MELNSFNPYNGELLGSLSMDSFDSIFSKINKLKSENFKLDKISKRVELLKKLGYKIIEEHEKIAELISKEQGKPIVEAKSVEILAVLDSVFYVAENLEKFLAYERIKHSNPFFTHKDGFLRYEPYGVVLVISPWNYPFAIPMIEISLAVAAGNSVLFKPSTLTPLVGEKILKICKEAGLPVELAVMRGNDIEKIIEHVDFIAFTGSTETGQRILEKTAKGIKKVILELGGSDPMIVLDDVNIERAVNGCIWGSLVNAGQTCSAIKRVYVQRGIYDDFIQLLLEKIKLLKVGDPLLTDTDMGPIVSESQMNVLEYQIRDAVDKGAEVLYGNKREDLILYPTILINVEHSMSVMKEETFGPVIPVKVFDSDEQAVSLANDSKYGLTASVWTGNRKRGIKIAEGIEAGTVTINDHSYSFGEPGIFWGGIKMSGLGLSHGLYGVREMSRVKFISIDDDNFNEEMWWYPYNNRKNRVFTDALDFMFSENFMERMKSVLRNLDLIGKMRMNNLLSAAKRVFKGIK